MDLPDPKHLRALIAAAERRDLVAAATQLGLSPARLQSQLRQLEGTLSATLVSFDGDVVRLTEVGQRLLPQARRAAAEALRCAEIVARGDRPEPFELTIGTRYELGMSWLVPALEGLQSERPERQIHLRFGDSSELLRRMDRGQIDALISSVRLSRGDLEYATLHSEDYVFVAAPALLTERPLPNAAAASGHTLLDISEALPLFRYLLEALQDPTPWPFARTERLGTIAAIRYRALEGAGVAVLPLYFVREDLEAGRLRRLMSWLSLRQDAFRLVWRAGEALDDELHRLGRALQRRPLC